MVKFPTVTVVYLAEQERYKRQTGTSEDDGSIILQFTTDDLVAVKR